jgi:hypothetical protein
MCIRDSNDVDDVHGQQLCDKSRHRHKADDWASVHLAVRRSHDAGEGIPAFFAITEAFVGKHLGGRVEPIGEAFNGSSVTVRQGRELVPGLPSTAPAATR